MMENPTLHVPQIHSDFGFSIARALLLMVGLVALLGMIYLTQSSQATLTGTHTLELQDKLERLRRENMQLEYEIAVLTTPDRIARTATRLGLRPATITQTTFLVVKDYPVVSKSAPRNVEPATAVTGSNPIELLWNELLARLGLLPSARTAEASP
jgi:cell division protein FtsB